VRIVVLMDLPAAARYHRATVDALGHAAKGGGRSVELQVRRTDDAGLAAAVDRADGLVIGPGSPYRDEASLWEAVRAARERGLPLVGT
jgi:CTP synthase (UTP-ammonia lyase)